MFRKTDIKPFEKKIWLASPTMHKEELEYINDAFEKNWITTAGENVDELEKTVAEYIGCKYSVGLSCGTASLHLAIKYAGTEVYGMPDAVHGALEGKRVFCSDLTFCATANPIIYEGGIPVFIDAEKDTWNMDPEALEKAFEIYPEVRIVVCAHLYGTPAKLDELNEVINRHNAILIEDAAESLGATYKGLQTGSIGKYNVVSFNGNKIITGSSGGCFLTDNPDAAEKIRKWSTQSREKAVWYQHNEIGYNYRISNVVAGIVRGQFNHLDEHLALKKAIYMRYKEGFKDLPIHMNPYDESKSKSNFWLSCIIIDEEAMSEQLRCEDSVSYKKEDGKTCPTEIIEVLASINAEGRPVWKPMHAQPAFCKNAFVSADREASDGIGMDIFHRGVCLPSDIKMTVDEQEKIIEVIRACFG